MYYVYILRCEDQSLYTGITTDIQRRFQEHYQRTSRAAKYTRVHQVVKIEALWSCQNRQQASQLEYYLKKLTKRDKENLIHDHERFAKYFACFLDTSLYQRINSFKI